MGIKQRQEKKKKAREVKAKETVVKKRESTRKKASHDRKVAKLEKETRYKLTPYVNPKKKQEEIKSQLEHNVQILKALEEEYGITAQQKKDLHESLELEGHMTLKDKMDALEGKKNEMLGITENYQYNELKQGE